MPETNILVREAAIYCLSKIDTGFNARLAAIVNRYGIESAEIDFHPGSASFVQVPISSFDEDISSQIEANPAINLWTSDWANEGDETGVLVTCKMTLHVDIYLKFRQGAERDDVIERTADAYQDAAITCLTDNTEGLHARGIPWDKRYVVPKGSAALLGDGWSLVVPIEFRVGVRSL